MAFTKVVGPGIHTLSNIASHNINSSGIITATKFVGPITGGGGDFNAGIVTCTTLDLNGNGDISGNLVVGGNLTAQGDFTTLNTTLRNVELLRVDADADVAAGIITQTGNGHGLVLADDTTFKMAMNVGSGIATFRALNAGYSAHNGASGIFQQVDLNTAAVTFGNSISVNGATITTGNGSHRIRSAANDFAIEHTTSSYKGFRFLGNVPADTFVMNASGNIGIGTATPDSKLNLFGTGSDAATRISIKDGTGIANVVGRYGSLTFQSDVDGAVSGSLINFAIDGSEKVRITSDGFVGIGVTNPEDYDSAGKNLVVGSSGQEGITIRSSSPNTGNLLFNDGLSLIAGISFKHSGVGTDRYFSFSINQGSGYVEQLRIQDGKLILSNDQDTYITASGDNFRFTTGGTERVRINASGNVKLPDSAELQFGGALHTGNGDVRVYYDPAGSSSFTIDSAAGYTYINSDALRLNSKTSAWNYLRGDKSDGVVKLYKSNSERLATSDAGITVTGEVAASQDYPNFRPVLDFNFAATKKLKSYMTFAREGEASFHDGVGSVKFVGDNEPRFEHDILTGECKGLMFEPAGTNYSWYSRRFDMVNTGSWIKVTGNVNIIANSHTAPDGTSSGVFMADTISGANGTTFNGNVCRQQITAGAGVKHTLSVYVKLLTSTQATIYVRDGATGSTASANAVNVKGWQRVAVTSNNALTNGTVHSFYIGNTNGDIAVWGSQIERSDYVTSYIKTDTGVDGTRNKDNGGVRLDGEDITDVFNDGRGTLIAEAIPTNVLHNQGLVGFYENFTDDNRVELRTMGSSGSTANARFEAVVSDSSVASLSTGLTHSGVNNVSKYAYAFELNNYAGCVNGGTVQTDTNGAFPSGMNSMIIGDSVYSQDASVIVKRIMYYADRLPNSQLVTLTS